MGWLEGVWDGNSMLKFQHTYADFPAGKTPNADISAHMLERQHNEYYKLKNCLLRHLDTCILGILGYLHTWDTCILAYLLWSALVYIDLPWSAWADSDHYTKA